MLASFWRRFLGGLIDLIITFPIAWVGSKYRIGQSNILLQFMFLVIDASYYVIFWKIKSATPGMMICKIKIVSVDGKPVTVNRLIIRYIGLCISCLFIGIGSMWMLLNNKRQTWQDKMAKTLVVKL